MYQPGDCTYYSHCHLQDGGGKLAVVGSAHVFSDGYIDKEENSKLQEIIFKWLTTDQVSLNQIDAENPEVSEQFISPTLYPWCIVTLPTPYPWCILMLPPPTPGVLSRSPPSTPGILSRSPPPTPGVFSRSPPPTPTRSQTTTFCQTLGKWQRS